MRRPRLELPGIPQHITHRGVNRGATFIDDEDFASYLQALKRVSGEQGVSIHGYVLMTNHVHLLVSAEVAGAVSRMMQALGRRYVRAFNARHGRTGTLWEGRYKSCLVATDRYLLACLRYIELNPLRAAMVAQPWHYRWSSVHGHLGLRVDARLRGAAPALFGSAIGDHTAPGVAGLALREIPGRDRTTPAGRFVGGFGPSVDAGRVLWVDYDSAVSIHPTATGVPRERRAERLASPSPDDNRITHGCINVAPDFYEQVIEPTFARGGVFYILPETASIADALPGFAQTQRRAAVQDD